MQGSTVLTVLLNWRTPDMTLRALASAREAMRQVAGGIVIVDNDSGDGSYEKLVEATHGMNDVRVIQSGRNGGFGAGNNVGIRAGLPDGSKPDYVYVLNSDAFPEPDAIRQLVNYVEARPKVGFAGSWVVGDDGVPHRGTFNFPSIWSELEGAARIGPITRLLKNKVLSQPIPETSGRVDWIVGASLLMRQSLLDQIGLFDEVFFLYFEETDLCLRASQAGSEVHFVRESHVVHIGGASTGMKTWEKTPTYWFDSRHYYFAKNHGKFGLLMATMMHATGGLLHRLRCLLTGKKPVDPPKFLRELIGYDAAHLTKPLPDPQTS